MRILRVAFRVALGAIILLCLLSSCGQGGGSGARKEQSAQTASSTAATRKPSPKATSINITPGMSALAFEGQLKANEDAEFVIGEEAGSLLHVHALASGKDLEVAVYRADTGEKLSDGHENPSFWSGRLPLTMGYLIVVHGTPEDTDYALELEVPRRLHLDGVPDSSVNAWAPAGVPIAFLVPANAKRNLSLDLKDSSPGAFLTVQRLDNGSLIQNAVARSASFTGELPASVDTLVRVYQGTKPGPFTLHVSAQ